MTLALRDLIETAAGLADEIARDPQLDRLLRVFGRMPAEDRDIILGVLEREVELRVLEQTAEQGALSGMAATRPNPNARLYLRLVRGEATVPYLSREEIMHAIVRAGRSMHQTLATTSDDVGWWAAVVAALSTLEPAARAAVRWTNRTMLELLDAAEAAAPGPPGPGRRD